MQGPNTTKLYITALQKGGNRTAELQKPATTLAVLGEQLDFWETFFTKTYTILSHLTFNFKLISFELQKNTKKQSCITIYLILLKTT